MSNFWGAVQILNNFQGMVRCIWASKFDGSDNVRPVLAF